MRGEDGGDELRRNKEYSKDQEDRRSRGGRWCEGDGDKNGRRRREELWQKRSERHINICKWKKEERDSGKRRRRRRGNVNRSRRGRWREKIVEI